MACTRCTQVSRTTENDGNTIFRNGIIRPNSKTSKPGEQMIKLSMPKLVSYSIFLFGCGERLSHKAHSNAQLQEILLRDSYKVSTYSGKETNISDKSKAGFMFRGLRDAPDWMGQFVICENPDIFNLYEKLFSDPTLKFERKWFENPAPQQKYPNTNIPITDRCANLATFDNKLSERIYAEATDEINKISESSLAKNGTVKTLLDFLKTDQGKFIYLSTCFSEFGANMITGKLIESHKPTKIVSEVYSKKDMIFNIVEKLHLFDDNTYIKVQSQDDSKAWKEIEAQSTQYFCSYVGSLKGNLADGIINEPLDFLFIADKEQLENMKFFRYLKSEVNTEIKDVTFTEHKKFYSFVGKVRTLLLTLGAQPKPGNEIISANPYIRKVSN